MSKSNYIENKDGTVVVALDYGMSWDYEDAIKEFPVGSYVILYGRKNVNRGDSVEQYNFIIDNGRGIPGNMNREICRYHGFRGETEGYAKMGLWQAPNLGRNRILFRIRCAIQWSNPFSSQ